MDEVYARVARDLERVKKSVQALAEGEDAPVAQWSAEQLRTWTARPLDHEGREMAPEHHAGVGVEVEFRDFAVLSTWLREHTTLTEAFRVGHVSWHLTDERRDELMRQVRADAVRDAAERAQLYADALDLGAVSPVAIADPGMLTPTRGDGDFGGIHAAPMARAAAPGYATEVELVPRDIEITASVEARFVVG